MYVINLRVCKNLIGLSRFDEYFTDPIDIHEKFQHQVDLVIDGGDGGIIPSTLLDCTKTEFELIRQGAGELDW